MKILTINKKDHVLKFTSEKISQLNAKGITLNTLTEDMQNMKLDRLYEAFCYGLQAMNHSITIEDTYDIIDQYYADDEDNDIEKFFMIVLEEYASAMGLGKKFKDLMSNQPKA